MTHGLPLLNEVALDNLPQLKGGNRNDIVLASPSLHKNCENLKCLFPITLGHSSLQKLENIIFGRVSKLEQVFEGDEPNVSKEEEKVIHLLRLTDLQLDGLPNLVSFGAVGYHFVFQSLLILRVVDCPNITTRFSFDSEKSVHAKTQACHLVDEIIVEESATAQETRWPIGSDIHWLKHI
ncbi:hypothetical protein GOBAR_AA08211 [Gossypium barbadense]|uniref:Disease resistance protein At4g27190-like leucine-rich repeats domain-containing protein n=1 Tax=Gossypium barbadense TaxID=3634 RepID=A0A2P5YA31_GOSBA|nr:hypothetical protein GOBAR_AA08211 [Gossypium barbadense]